MPNILKDQLDSEIYSEVKILLGKNHRQVVFCVALLHLSCILSYSNYTINQKELL
jgi:hypothetical protein